jgi:CHAT domain-containing protein/Tfp pilus assembly protein PilF
MIRSGLRPAWCFALAVLACSVVFLSPRPVRPDGPSDDATRRAREKDLERLFAEVGRLGKLGMWDKALSTNRKGLALHQKRFGPSPQLALAYELAARDHEQHQKFPAAVALWREALALRTRLHGASHWQTVDARLSLAHAELLGKFTARQWNQFGEAAKHQEQGDQLWSQKDYAAAAQAYERALAIRRRLLGDKHRDTLLTRLNLAVVQHSTPAADKATPLFEEVVSGYKKLLGDRHPTYLYALDWQAWHHLDRRRPARALALYRQVLALRAKAFGRDAEYRRILGNAIRAAEGAGDVKQHERLLLRAVELARATPGDPELPERLHALGKFYKGRGDLDRAEQALRAALNAPRSSRGVPRRQGTGGGRVVRVPLETPPPSEDSEDRRLKETASIRKDLAEVYRALRPKRLRALGEKHADYRALLARMEKVLADTVRERRLSRNLAEVRANLVELTELRSALFGAKHWRTIDTRAERARVDRELRLSFNGRDNLQRADSLTDRVNHDYDAGHFQDALWNAQTAQRLYATLLGADSPEHAGALNNRGMLHRALGDPERAVPFLSRAWEIRRRVLGDDHPQTAISLNNLGQAYFDLGDLTRADRSLRRSLAALAKVIDPKHTAYIAALNNLAVLHLDQGDFAGAEPLCRQVLKLHLEDRADPPEVRAARAEELPGLRSALMGEINWVGALFEDPKHYEDSDEESPGDVLLHSTYLNNLALANLGLGKTEAAEKSLREAVELFEALVRKPPRSGRLYPAGSAQHATALNNLALLLIRREKYDQAELLLKRSLAIHKKRVGERHPDYAVGLTSLGGLAHARGDWKKAEEFFRQALAVCKVAPGPTSRRYAEALSNLARILDVQGKAKEALPLARQAVDVIRGRLGLTAAIQSERQQLGYLRYLRGILDHYLSLALRTDAAAEEVYAPLLNWKGSVFSRQQRLRERRLGADQEDVAELRTDLERVTRELGSLSRQPTPDAKKVADLERRQEDLERKLAGKLPAVRRRRQAEALTPAALKSALPRGVVLVDFLEFWHDEPARGREPRRRIPHLLAVVVRQGQPIRVLDLGRSAPIAEAVADWRGTLKRRRPTEGKGGPAGTLRKALLDPLAKELAGAKALLVSPDGPVSRLPFAALPGRDAKKYLIEEVAVAVVPVPQLLPGLLARKAAAKEEDPSMLLVGDVDFDAAPGAGAAAGAAASRGDQTWERLPATRDELLAVRDSFEQKYPFPDGQAFALRGARATAGNFRREASRHRWLHLATHGFFAPRTAHSALGKESAGRGTGGASAAAGQHPGLLSGLALAGANRTPEPGQDDGVLTALEVAEMDLGRTELVVLSACETGLGELAGGEGVLGLQRAFQVAGARSVVASLWKVDDEATRKLMSRFYEELWQKGRPRLEALRQAQLIMLREGYKRGMALRTKAEKGDRVPPFYWAAFVLSGDWR